MKELNEKEQAMLRSIMGDKYAAGPFTGMIFNQVSGIVSNSFITDSLDKIDVDNIITNVTWLALRTRIKMTKLGGE